MTSILQPIQDTIEFSLVAEETVVNNTVKLSATVSSIVTPDMTESKLKDGIREMMKKIVSETKGDDGKKPVNWQFSNMTRTPVSGMEQIVLTATTRVHESDNHSLDKRRQEVSQEGMTITQIAADTTPPMHMIEATESNLRLKLLTKAQAELEKINKCLVGVEDTQYRLGSVQFENANDYAASNSPRGGAMKTAYAASYGSGFSEDNTLGNAVKLSMRATITLSRTVA